MLVGLRASVETSIHRDVVGVGAVVVSGEVFRMTS
jgi:hypothetical protein